MTNKNVAEFKAKLEEKVSKEEAKKAIQVILKLQNIHYYISSTCQIQLIKNQSYN